MYEPNQSFINKYKGAEEMAPVFLLNKFRCNLNESGPMKVSQAGGRGMFSITSTLEMYRQ